MNCLTDERLVRCALEAEVESAVQVHLDACGICRDRLVEMRALGDRLSRAHERFEHGHEQQRAELLAALTSEERAAPAKPRPRTNATWHGGLTMGQKTVLGGVGVAVLVLIVFAWSSNTARRATAMERMAQNIRQAKSWQATMDVEKARFDEHGNPAPPSKQALTFYWQAPGSTRMNAEMVAGRKVTEIYHGDKPGINIDHFNKKFRLTPARQGDVPPLMLLDRLSQYSGQAKRELGVKEIDGKAARGFDVDIKKIDPSGPAGEAEIWIDTDTDLPVLLRYKFTEGGEQGALTMRDFRWNVEFDPELFDATPPEGYTDATPPEAPLEQQVREIAEALEVYAELAGEYPQAKVVYGDVTRDEMYRMIGIKGGRPTREQSGTEVYGKVLKAMKGFAGLNVIVFRENPDGAYYGLSVGPKDAGKVLVRWKLAEGRYQVIYGDLHDEIVSAERLRELESR